MHGTEEARRVPAALTTRAKQEGRRNDKKRRLVLRESDRLIVSSGNPAEAEPKTGEGADVLAKHTQATRAVRMTDQTGKPSCERRERVNTKSPVREYRPPGSVRGAPGNRCPYLDKR